MLKYIEKTKTIGLLESPYDERVGGKNSRGMNVITLGLEELNQAHLYTMNNTNEVVPYIVRHKALVKESIQKMTKE